MIECKICGASGRAGQAFCPGCGALSARAAPIASKVGAAISDRAEGLSDRFDESSRYVSAPENRKRVIAGSAAIVLMAIAFTNNPIAKGIATLLGGDVQGPQFTEDGAPDFAAYQDVFLSDEAEYVVLGRANVRNFPTSQGTIISRRLAVGEIVQAREVMAFDPSSQWLKLSGGGYVWGRNLESIDQIAHESGPQFPDHLQGRWSTMDTCRGAELDAEILVTPNLIQFYESTGTLVSVAEDSRGKPIYELAMSGEGTQWTKQFSIMVTANGFSLLFDDIDYPDQSMIYHSPEIGCDRVFFGD